VAKKSEEKTKKQKKSKKSKKETIIQQLEEKTVPESKVEEHITIKILEDENIIEKVDEIPKPDRVISTIDIKETTVTLNKDFEKPIKESFEVHEAVTDIPKTHIEQPIETLPEVIKSVISEIEVTPQKQLIDKPIEKN